MTSMIPTTLKSEDQIKIVRELLGTPYTRNGRNVKEGLDCWSATQLLQKRLFGRDLPDLEIEDDSIKGFIKAVTQGELLCNWVQIEEPVHGCIVELCRSKVPHHCGTFLDIPELKVKGLVHALKGAGVIFDPWITLKAAGWRRFIYNVPRSS